MGSKISLIFLIKLVLCTCLMPSFAQQSLEQENIVIDINEIDNDNERTEIQRYTGYEELLTRYITLPYDVSANTSRQGRYFDIGYLLFALFPIALLILTYKKKFLFYTILISSLIYLGICFDTTYVNVENNIALERRSEAWFTTDAIENATFIQTSLVHTYDLLASIAFPFIKTLESISGTDDHISYPLLSLLFILSILLFAKLLPNRSKGSVLSIITTIFFFLWLLFSGGIIWYGLLLIPILFGCSFFVLNRYANVHAKQSSLFKAIIIIPCVLWMTLAYAARVSNIDSQTVTENLGKSIINPSLVFYSTGVHSAAQSRALIYNGIGAALDEINDNDELIYQVGTSMAFEINNSTTRCIKDNLLQSIYWLVNQYKRMDILDEFLKASEIKYVIVDLYTYTLDKTPEKSLTKKFQLFVNAIQESPGLRLMATDRQLEIKKYSGEVITTYAVFPGDDPAISQVNLKSHGSYAIFEVL